MEKIVSEIARNASIYIHDECKKVSEAPEAMLIVAVHLDMLARVAAATVMSNLTLDSDEFFKNIIEKVKEISNTYIEEFKNANYN